MKRTRQDSAVPHDRHEKPPRPHALSEPSAAGHPTSPSAPAEAADAQLPSHNRLPPDALSRLDWDNARPTQTEHCPHIRAYSVSLIRLPGGRLRVAFFEGEGIRPRTAAPRQG
jgi:hypothetical protein